MALPDLLLDLLHNAAYPHPCEQIELIETHISWVFLTGEFAYKLKKPVHYSFVDFSTLELREHFCREELRCNRAFALDLYLDVVPLVLEDEHLRVGSADDPERRDAVEWAVKMRQFDPAAGADRLLARGLLDSQALRTFGRSLAARHAGLPRHEGTAEEVPGRVFGPVEDNFSEIAKTGLALQHADLLLKAHERARSVGNSLRSLLNERMTGGFIRECHGDLHLANLARIDGGITAFDCLEFNANLRWIDTLSDVAFLFMDCHERNRADLAYAFLDGYLDTCGDYRGAPLLGFYAAYRSVVRAKVAALRWAQNQEKDAALRFVRHIEWAHARLASPPGKLILMCGLSGSGKSTVADRLVPRIPAIRLRSDVARKTLAGLTARAKTASPIGGGLYDPQRSDAVFEFLADVAEALLRGGDNVIVDATFITRGRRNQFHALAKRVDTKVCVILCDAPIDILRERIRARSTANDDPSEATLEVLDAQLKKFESPGTDESVIQLNTGKPLDDDELEIDWQ
jgi:aminoglycoside phosphotransferase family enzyme/predicted kinase